MEPSGGGAEECNSNESGWTMYIASPSNEYDDQEDYNNEDHQITDRARSKNSDGVECAENDDSDDSMASDASSGPSYQEICQGYGRSSNGKEKIKYGGEKETGKFSIKKHQKEEVNKFSKNTKVVNEDAHRAKSSYGQSRSFLRKK